MLRFVHRSCEERIVCYDAAMFCYRMHASPRFWKPGSEAPGVQDERETVSDRHAAIYNSYGSMPLSSQRQRLPIFTHRSHILYLLEEHRTLVLVGETGCGKSTQLPQYLLEAGWAAGGRVIGIVQPRRVAAVTLAKRVADERSAVLGGEVGYAVRFDERCDTTTRLRFMTDGILLRELLDDPLLSRYSVIILDEAHERSLNTDVLAGLLSKVQRRRPELRVVIASATLDAQLFFQFFNTKGDNGRDTAVMLTVEGRMFPVQVLYGVDPVPDYVRGAVETALSIHQKEREGDVLMFLTGQEEVERAVGLLRERGGRALQVLPLHGSLPDREQLKAFERAPRGTRKVIVATNIAEASVTIDGIAYVIDCGFVKQRAYNPACGAESLVIVPASLANAEQRAGRAGRVRAGKVYRLYPEEAAAQLPKASTPEMQRSDLAGVVLQLKALGVDNVLRFPFLSAPPAACLLRAVELLYALGAVDADCALTDPLGQRMADFPLPPMPAKMLLDSKQFGCSQEALTIAAMMQIQDVFTTGSGRAQAARQKRRFSAAEGDHLSLLNVFNAFVAHAGRNQRRWCQKCCLNYRGLCRAAQIRDQLAKHMRRAGVPLLSCDTDADAIRRCITAAFFANAARLHHSGVYRTVRDDHTLHIHPTSVLAVETPPAWVVFSELVRTTKDFMRDVTVIDPEWLYELAPHYYQFGTDRERAIAKRTRFLWMT